MPRGESEYLESKQGWYKPGELNEFGHQVYYGWDTSAHKWYVKTHRGQRGKRKSEQTAELLALREQVRKQQEQLSEYQQNEDTEIKKREELEARLEVEQSELLDTKQEFWNLEQKYQELLASQADPGPSNPYLSDTGQPAASSSSSRAPHQGNKQTAGAAAAAPERVPETPVKIEDGEPVKTESGEFYVASIDYNRVLNRDPTWSEGVNYRRIYQPISESISRAVEDLLDSGLQVVVCSFAVERAASVLEELATWRLWDRISDTIIVNQRHGAPYDREGNGELTTGGKDFNLAKRGIRHHIEDNDRICKAAEAQDITVYRINPDPGDWETHRGFESFDTTEGALQRVLQEFKRNPESFRCDGVDFFVKEKVPWFKSSRNKCWICNEEGHKSFECPNKGKGKGKGKDRRRK